MCLSHKMKEFNEITMIRVRKIVYIATILATAILLCTGCSSERKEKQLTLREQGITHLENEQYDKALAVFQSALDESLGKIGEVELDICYYKAQAQYLSGDVEGAIATYTAIINYNNAPKAYYLRGNLYYSLYQAGETESEQDVDYETMAIADYAQAVKYEKSDYELYIGIYEALNAHDKQAEGLEYLAKALELQGNTAYDKMQKGWIHFLLGEYGEAVALLKEAAEGKELESYYCLAEVYLTTGDMENAQNNMNAYISSGIADAHKLYNVAKLQMSKENYEMAINCLESALKLEKVPNKQIVMKTLVIAYEKINNFIAARDVLTDYVQQYPEDEEAARELTFLETR